MKLDYTVIIDISRDYFFGIQKKHIVYQYGFFPSHCCLESLETNRWKERIDYWCETLKRVLIKHGFIPNVRKIIPINDIIKNNILYPVTWTLEIDGNIIKIPENKNCVDVYSDIFIKKMQERLDIKGNQLDEIRELIKDIVKHTVSFLQTSISDGVSEAEYLLCRRIELDEKCL